MFKSQILSLITRVLALGLLLPFMAACNDDEEAVVPAQLNFTQTTAGITANANQVQVQLVFSRPIESAGNLELSLSSTNLTYGQTADFYTEPAAANNVLTLPFTEGTDAISFNVVAGSGLNIQEDRTLSISFTTPEDFPAQAGNNQSIEITFSENFIAASGTIEFNGGEGFPNQAFVDLSKQTQTVVNKLSWDLGFYTGSGQHRVVLNSPAYNMARPLEKTDLTQVTAQDTMGFAAAMQVPQFNFAAGASAWVDTPNGDLSTTAFGEIAATDADNPVFIIKRNGNWKKVRVLQNGNGYTLQHADIDSPTFSTVNISKDATYNFVHVDLTEGTTVNAEPAKTQWDLMYSSYTVPLAVGPSVTTPYGFNDFVLTNRNGVEVVRVDGDQAAYDAYTLTDAQSLTLETATNTIGSSWRNGGGPGSAPFLYTDHFYVIKDVDGNIYKLRFTRLYKNETERGFAEFTYAKLN